MQRERKRGILVSKEFKTLSERVQNWPRTIPRMHKRCGMKKQQELLFQDLHICRWPVVQISSLEDGRGGKEQRNLVCPDKEEENLPLFPEWYGTESHKNGILPISKMSFSRIHGRRKNILIFSQKKPHSHIATMKNLEKIFIFYAAKGFFMCGGHT